MKKLLRKLADHFKEKEATNEEKVERLLFGFNKITTNDSAGNKAEVFNRFRNALRDDLKKTSDDYKDKGRVNYTLSDKYYNASLNI